VIFFLYQKLREAKVELIRFLIIGGLSTILNYLVFLALLHGLNFNYLISNSLEFIAGVSFGYLFNKKWTFGHQQKIPGFYPFGIRHHGMRHS
jgi:putative flippase GtrA